MNKDNWHINIGLRQAQTQHTIHYQPKNSQNFDKNLRFLKISTDFQIVFKSKYSKKIFLNLSCQLHQGVVSIWL